jgi:hypothetical protein
MNPNSRTRQGNAATRFKPVFSGRHHCVGHIIGGARGVRAFDRRDALVGYFPTEAEAAQALIDLSGGKE